MRDPDRIPELLDALAAAWRTAPDERFGQFVDNIASLSSLNVRLAEDDQWLAAIDAYAHHMRDVTGGGSG